MYVDVIDDITTHAIYHVFATYLPSTSVIAMYTEASSAGLSCVECTFLFLL